KELRCEVPLELRISDQRLTGTSRQSPILDSSHRSLRPMAKLALPILEERWILRYQTLRGQDEQDRKKGYGVRSVPPARVMWFDNLPLRRKLGYHLLAEAEMK